MKILSRLQNTDPILQFPENSQNYNKYSYVMNNPMKYVDPSGYEMSEWQFQSMMYMHSRSWQRYLNECGITGMDDFAYGMGVEAGMEALIHSITPKGPGVNEDDGPPDADELEDRTLGGSGDGDDVTVINNSSFPIMVKPEDGSPVIIYSGESYDGGAIDGFTFPFQEGMVVYKVRDPFNLHTWVITDESISIMGDDFGLLKSVNDNGAGVVSYDWIYRDIKNRGGSVDNTLGGWRPLFEFTYYNYH